MCSEIDRFSSFLRRMSGNRHIFPVERKNEKQGIIISETPADSHPQTVPESEEREKENLEDEEGDHQKQPEEIKNKEDETDKAAVSHRQSDDNYKEDDGYETPTSSDHRIPPITQCPPAPMKPRPPPSKLKRKLSPPSRSIQLDSSADVESIFSPIAHDDQDDAQQHKIKRARTDDKDRS